MKISREITKAIKQGCWLQIHYKNTDRDTYFWCAITDIDIPRKMLIVDMHNSIHGDISGSIYFDKIVNARVIRNTYYEVPNELMDKIINNIDELDWLNFDEKDLNLLEYYKECYYNDHDSSLKHYNMIDGIDNDLLFKSLHDTNDGKFKLTLTQLEQIKEKLNLKNILSNYDIPETTELGLNIFSLASDDNVYVVAYKLVRFNPKDRTLKLKDQVLFNQNLIIKGKKENLSALFDYPDLDVLNNYIRYRNDNLEVKEVTEEFKKVITERIKLKVKQDERPYLIVLDKEVKISINEELNAISSMYKEDTLTHPLKAFFGKLTKRNIRRKNYPIALYDRKVNSDQLRVINNAIKNPVTYVQGPPGTGKTHTILNIIVSAFYNNRTVLIVSHNNKPINDIYKKLTNLKYNNNKIPFPIIRLGNKDVIKRTLITLKKLFDECNKVEVPSLNLNEFKNKQEYDLKKLNELLEEQEKRAELEDQIDSIENFHKLMMDKDSFRSFIYEVKYQELKKELESIPKLSNEELLNYVIINEEFKTWLYYTSISRIKRLNEPKYEQLREILETDFNRKEEIEKAVIAFNQYLRVDDNLRDFLRVFPIIASTNLSTTRLGSAKIQFDLVIVDEAGQCSVASSLPAIVRADSLVLVGDLNQLQPVVVLDQELNEYLMELYNVGDDYNYCESSILKVMSSVDQVSKFIMLKKHYRCVKDIISFSNQKYYGNLLEYERMNKINVEHLQYYNVQSSKDDVVEKNTSRAEAKEIIKAIKENNFKNVGVITPFRNQAKLIREFVIDNDLNDIVEVGTIHSFQGGEKDVIFISTAITSLTREGAFNWVKNNSELINVGVTRAKDYLVLVGDFKEIEHKSKNYPNDLNDLAKYIKSKGKYRVNSRDDSSIVNRSMNLKKLNTKSEKELLETLVQILSLNNRYKVKEKVKASSVIAKCKIEDKGYYLQSEFDFVIYDEREMPVLIIELNGREHYTDQKVMIRDQKKRELVANNIKLITITNDFTRKYQFIKNYIKTIIEDI